MKIIDPYPENNGWTMEAFCTGKGWDQNGLVPCNAKLEVADIDMQVRYYTDYGGGTDEYFGVCCPICYCFTEVDKNKLPQHVKEMARKHPYKKIRKY